MAPWQPVENDEIILRAFEKILATAGASIGHPVPLMPLWPGGLGAGACSTREPRAPAMRPRAPGPGKGDRQQRVGCKEQLCQ
jgi:hypothetical protein